MGRVPRPTDRLSFRELRAADLTFMTRLLGDPESMRHYPRPFGREDAKDWIAWNRRLYRERGFGLWLLTLRASGEPVGDCGLTPQDAGGITEIEIGYHVRADMQRRGYATEAATAVRDFALTVLGLTRLVAIIEPANTPSRRVAEKLGLELDGVIERAGRPRLLYAMGPRPQPPTAHARRAISTSMRASSSAATTRARAGPTKSPSCARAISVIMVR